MIFVRHGRAIVQRAVPTHEWPLDPESVGDIEQLRASLPQLPVVCSDMRRAIETAQHLGEPTIDARLAEVSRPWTNDLRAAVGRYFLGETLDGWEPQADARARVQSVVDEHGDVLYVTHGTVLSLYLASVVPPLDALDFWTELTTPDAWRLREGRLIRVA